MNLANTFNGKSVLVTGAASGIGRSIAQQTAAAGAKVLLTDVVDEVHETATKIGHGAGSMIVDVSDRDQVAAAVDRVVEEHGSIDFIFNNAGVAIFGDVELVSLDEWDKIIDVNMKGVAYGTKLAYDQMVKQGSGHIINTASAAGLVPVPLQAHYCATKHAVVGLGKTLALEAIDHGVHVTTFCPGFTQTGMMTNNTTHGRLDIPNIAGLVPVPPTPVDRAVKRLLSGVAKRRHIVVTPFYARLGWWVERLSLPLSYRQHRVLFKETMRRAAKIKRKSEKSEARSKIPA